MAEITWKETPSTWTAYVEDKAICALKGKDIGGWAANWLNGRTWPAPAHMPKAKPQEVRFFAHLHEAKDEVEKAMK
jgi:hypothetical protein